MGNDDFLQATVEAWQPYYEETLSQADAADIAENWSAYLNVLSRWAEAAHAR